MGDAEQTRITLECFPSLTEEQTKKVLEQWATGDYEDTWHGHQKAQADLMKLCRWESMSAQQQQDENLRLRKGKY